MRRFRFTGISGELIKNGDVFNENHLFGFTTVSSLAVKAPNEWQEVTEESLKNLHKDTDLGYFAGMFAQAGWGYDDCIKIAKNLIEALDKEVGNG